MSSRKYILNRCFVLQNFRLARNSGIVLHSYTESKQRTAHRKREQQQQQTSKLHQTWLQGKMVKFAPLSWILVSHLGCSYQSFITMSAKVALVGTNNIKGLLYLIMPGFFLIEREVGGNNKTQSFKLWLLISLESFLFLLPSVFSVYVPNMSSLRYFWRLSFA